MKNTFGTQVCVTIFGESHGAGIGAVLEGMAPGMAVDEELITRRLAQRRGESDLSTARREADAFRIESGVFGGYTTGAPICIFIPNGEQRSRDYGKTKDLARPGHADYPAHCKYGGFEDYRGGGHFSGRVTAGLVAVGAIAEKALLDRYGIVIGTHLSRCAGVLDRDFRADALGDDIAYLKEAAFPALDAAAEAQMKEKIREARAAGDSVGGVLETAVIGMPAGIGEPFFDSVESVLSHMLFSIPGIKGVEFGDGFRLSDMTGSRANDGYRMDGETVRAVSNHGGGIGGGITSGMPLLFRCAVKPTPSIYLEQETVNMASMENATLKIEGRHDPCIAHRARTVVDAATALALCDLLAAAKR